MEIPELWGEREVASALLATKKEEISIGTMGDPQEVK